MSPGKSPARAVGPLLPLVGPTREQQEEILTTIKVARIEAVYYVYADGTGYCELCKLGHRSQILNAQATRDQWMAAIYSLLESKK